MRALGTTVSHSVILQVGTMSSASPTPFLFVRSLLLNPRAMGALAPSSPKLSQLMASLVDPANSSVLEIGAGTGAVTRALLARNVHPDRLIIIERDPSLAAFLRHEFPGVRVRCGEAIHLSRILSDESVRRVDTVVSSLPLRNLPRVDRIRNVRAMVNVLAHEGQLIQYTYFAGCPIPSSRLGLEAERLGRVWLNLPPASVCRFTVKRPFPAA
jgi:phosphatidylethanolamine/phosphatidyl-N-methylethanolamine N-methyltransferase